MARGNRSILAPRFVAALSRAQFAFVGTVRRDGSNLTEIAPSGCSVVLVTQAILAPLELGDISGREVTLRWTVRPLPKGTRAVFLASSWMYGAQLAVNEVATLTGRLDLRSIRSALVAEGLRELDQALSRRIATADLVVVGRVVATQPLESTRDIEDEDIGWWRIAVLSPNSFIKGRGSASPQVLFPSPRARRFAESPTFLADQEGVWILRRVAAPKKASRRDGVPPVRGAFTALDPLDFQGPSLASRIYILNLVAAAPRTRRRG